MSQCSAEAERRQRIISELIPLHETIESNSERLSTLLSSCQRPQHLHSSMTSCVDVMKRIVAKSVSVGSRATRGEAVASDVAMMLELVSQSHKVIDSATVQVGEDTCLSVCLRLCS